MIYQLDLTAYQCPIPLLMADKALQGLGAGEQIILLISEQSTLQDLQLLCAEKGYQMVANEHLANGDYQLTLRK